MFRKWFFVFLAVALLGIGALTQVAPTNSQSCHASELALGGAGYLRYSERARAEANYSSQIVFRVADNSTVALINGPICDNNNNLWWQIEYAGQVGWLVEVNTHSVQSMTASTPTQPSIPTPVNTPAAPQTPSQPFATPVIPAGGTPTPAFPGEGSNPGGITSSACNSRYSSTLAVGMTAEVTNRHEVYTEAGYFADTIGELNPREIVTLLTGPVCANNTYWWEVGNSAVRGWFNEMSQHGTLYLRAVTGVNPGTPPASIPPVAQPTQPPAVQQPAQPQPQQPSNTSTSSYCQVAFAASPGTAPIGTNVVLAANATCEGGVRAIRIGTGDTVLGEIGSTSLEVNFNSTGVSPGGKTFWAIATNGSWETGARSELNVQFQSSGDAWGEQVAPVQDNCRQIGCNGNPGGETNPPANSPQPSCNSATGLRTGDIVLISNASPNAARLRSGSSTDHSILVEIPVLTALTLIGGPQCGSGYVWWETQYNGHTGWVAEINLIRNGDPLPGGSNPGLSPTQPPPANPPAAGDNTCRHAAVQFPNGSGRVAYGDGIGSALQTQPFGPEVVMLPEGTALTIISDPTCINGLWWRFASSQGYEGFIADGDASGAWLEAVGQENQEHRTLVFRGECSTSDTLMQWMQSDPTNYLSMIIPHVPWKVPALILDFLSYLGTATDIASLDPIPQQIRYTQYTFVDFPDEWAINVEWIFEGKVIRSYYVVQEDQVCNFVVAANQYAESRDS